MPCLWQSLATARPMPEAAPVIRAELPALKTGCKGIFVIYRGSGSNSEFGLVGLSLFQMFGERSAVELRHHKFSNSFSNNAR